MSEKLPLRSCLSLTAGTDDDKDGRIFCVMLVLTLLWHQCLLLHLIMVILTCPLMPSVCGTYSNKNSTLGWKTSGNILLETTPASKPIKVGQLVVKLGYFLIHFFCWPTLPQQHSTAIYSDLIRTCSMYCFHWCKIAFSYNTAVHSMADKSVFINKCNYKVKWRQIE